MIMKTENELKEIQNQIEIILNIFYNKYTDKFKKYINDLNIFIPSCYINNINVENIVQKIFEENYNFKDFNNKNNIIFI